MPETTNTGSGSRRKLLIGQVVSTKMAKTIVVEVHRQKAHPLYRRVVAHSKKFYAKYKRTVRSTKKFYAHDAEQSAHLGDFVRIEETRPLSRLKRWRLKDILRRAALVAAEPKQETAEIS